MSAVASDDIRRLVKRWFALPHRTSATQPYRCVACRILVELMELVEAVQCPGCGRQQAECDSTPCYYTGSPAPTDGEAQPVQITPEDRTW